MKTAESSSTRLFSILLFLVILFPGISCNSTTGNDDSALEISEEEAIELLKQELQDRNLDPPAESDELSLSDYVATEVVSKTRHVRIWLDDEGYIIPGSKWRDANPDYCKKQNRYMRSAEKLLNFKLHPESQEATVQLIDVETGKIDQQQMGKGGSGPEGMAEAIADAWDKMDLEINTPGGPCGDKIGTEIAFESEITTAYPDVTIFDHVNAVFSPDYIESEDYYEGIGTLEYIEFTTSDLGECSISDAKIVLHYLSLPSSEVDEIEVIMTFDDFEMASCGPDNDPVPPLFPFAWSALHLEEANLQASPIEFTLTGWEEVPDESAVIARNVYDRTITTEDEGDEVTYTEKTTIEIRRDEF